MDISLIAALISLFFLVADPVAAKWNKTVYLKNQEKEDSKERFENAMKRRGNYKLFSLLFLILAALLTMYSTKEENEMTEKKLDELNESINQVNGTVKEIGGRIIKIEKFLWGGGGSGETPDDPNPHSPTDNPDSGYFTINERFTRIESTISDLSQRAVTQEDLEVIQKEIIELRRAIAEYEKLIVRIGVMSAP